jgi:MFS family permease
MTTPNPAPLDRSHKLVVFASSLGTVFEWYDFYIYGTLAVFFGKLFFPPGNETAAYLSSLALFGVGFSVRPFGALVFGRIGDMVGRKYTFLITILVMGLATALVGLLPTYRQIGFLAPVALVFLRLAQGLALGGEYGGAATYVAEHAPPGKRGFYTSWIQTTATVGLFLSLAVIGGLRIGLGYPADPADPKGPTAFEAWGWRIPFLVSIVLLAISVYIRLKLQESPVFAEMKAEGRASKAPLTESFARWGNGKIVLKALFGATAGQGVVWYCGQFYALYFLTTTLKVDYMHAYLFIALALLIGTPFFVIVGRISDRIGRKPVLLLGLLLAVLTYQPIFHALTRSANPALEAAIERSPVVLRTVDYRGRIGLTLEALGDAATKIVRPTKPVSDVDKARAYLNGKGIPFALAPAGQDATLALEVDGRSVAGFDAKAYDRALVGSGYDRIVDPRTKFADTSQMDKPRIVALLALLVFYVTLVYGPIAALLVELFPTRIRYTSMSLPYHIGNGWFGGFLPLIAASIALFTGDIYSGLWYPIVVAALCLVIGAIVLPETKDADLGS